MTDLAFIAPNLAPDPRPTRSRLLMNRFIPMPPRGSLLALAAAAAVVAPGLAASGAEAAVSCSFANAVVEVRLTGNFDSAALHVENGGIRANRSACGAATTVNTDAVLVKDMSDNPATPAGNDGNTYVGIEEPARFGPGKTDESFPAEDEIEIYVDANGGADRLVAGPISDSLESQYLTAGNGGVSWTRDGDADVVGMPFDEVVLAGGAGVDSLSGQGGSGTGAPLSNAAQFRASGLGGADLILGSDIAGGDTLDGGGGGDSDVIDAAAGDDTVYFDLIFSQPGDDRVTGGTGEDTLDFTTAPRAVTVDLARTDAQDTGFGIHTLTGFERVAGSDFDDRLSGTAGANILTGHDGDDTLEGRGSADGSDELHGGDGTDTVSHAGARGPVTVDLTTVAQPGGGDDLTAIENVIGSPIADTLTGDAGPNRLVGGPGADQIAAGDGADLLQLRDGEGDRAACGAGADTALSDRRSLDTVEADCETVDALPEPQPGGAGEQPGGGQTPDTTLQFTLAGAKRQRLVRQGAIRLRMQCPLEDCTAVATASGRVRGTRLRLRPRTLSVSDGPARTVELRLTRKLRRALRAALAAGTRPRLTVTARARDAAGNSVRKSLRVTAKR